MTLVHHPERCPANAKLRDFVAWWTESGPFPIVITSGDRTDAEQWALYQQGRTKPGRIVTQAKSAEESAHGHSGAIDCSPVRALYPSGSVRLIYTGDEAEPMERAEAQCRLDAYVELVRQHGLQSGADFPGLHDVPHAQDPDWKSLPVIA